MNNTNPLAQYTRQEKLFMPMPSKGHFYAAGTVNTNEQNEVGVRAMTANDEINAKTPDALLNGDAIVNMIESCVPSVTNARALALPDSEAILIAIRIASYGELMEVSAECPECAHENTYDANLQRCLDNMTFLEDNYTVDLPDSGLKFSLQPYTLSDQISNSLTKFKEQQVMNEMLSDDSGTDEEKQTQLNKSIHEIAEISFNLVANSVKEIRDPSGNVITMTDDEMSAGVRDLSISDSRAVIEKIAEINAIGIQKDIDAQCEECEHTWTTVLNYNPSDFFEIGSYS